MFILYCLCADVCVGVVKVQMSLGVCACASDETDMSHSEIYTTCNRSAAQIFWFLLLKAWAVGINRAPSTYILSFASSARHFVSFYRIKP